ncbi:MAG: hypothetical protein M1834_003048 [Cirrosporium novae-zelandiae]|nr:MAG: hypothetical protein M1834_003048 [Cirrosporium novae-zelandiae]
MSSPAPADESPTQRQARLRRERRQAKLQVGGAARLDKILNTSGRVAAVESRTAENDAPSPSPSPQPTTQIPEHHADPDEVDISTHPPPQPPQFQGPLPDYDPSQMAQLRQILRTSTPTSETPSSTSQQEPEDPMMKMLQQMMGGGGAGGPGGLPEGFPPIFPGMPDSQQQQQQQTPSGPSTSAYIWRIIHFLFAVSLGLYIVLYTSFKGLSRYTPTAPTHHSGTQIFAIFSSAELLLQATRFFIEKSTGRSTGSGGGSGVLGTMLGFLPEPWKSGVVLVRRYKGIWETVSADAMVVVWVMGAVAWWEGMGG